MHRFLILIFIVSCNMASSQILQNGLILPKQNDQQDLCCIYAPKDGFIIYNQPNGETIGQLTRNVKQNSDDQSAYRIYFVDHSTKTEREIEIQYFQEVAYEVWALAYAERRNGYVKFKNDGPDLWLKESDIEKVGFKLVEWQTFLADNVQSLLGFYANDPGLNLREEPHIAAKKIKTLKGMMHQILPTNEHHGLWTKVQVTISKEHPCQTELQEDENFIEVLEGWIKIVDDSGTPNIWFYSRGC